MPSTTVTATQMEQVTGDTGVLWDETTPSSLASQQFGASSPSTRTKRARGFGFAAALAAAGLSPGATITAISFKIIGAADSFGEFNPEGFCTTESSGTAIDADKATLPANVNASTPTDMVFTPGAPGSSYTGAILLEPTFKVGFWFRQTTIFEDSTITANGIQMTVTWTNPTGAPTNRPSAPVMQAMRARGRR